MAFLAPRNVSDFGVQKQVSSNFMHVETANTCKYDNVKDTIYSSKLSITSLIILHAAPHQLQRCQANPNQL